MRALFCGLLSVLITSGVAHAADPQIVTSPDLDPVRFGWTGAYVGGSVGYAWLRDVDNQFAPPLHDEGQDWNVGGHVGYLQQFGNFVVAAEAEAQAMDIRYELLDFIKVSSFYTLKGRAGVTFDRLLVTGHLGGTYATTNVGLKDWGWVVGAGVDYALTDHIIVGGQYSHHTFDTFDDTLIDATVDTVSARASYRF
jgi:outer membrane immunogenic protein